MKFVNLALMIMAASTLVCASTTPRQYVDDVRKFSLKSANTKWDFFSANDLSSKASRLDRNLQFVARSPNIYDGGVQPTLTLRIDKITRTITAKEYAERWLKDFPKFGFDMQSSHDAHYGTLDGYEIEAITHTKVIRHARQFIVGRPEFHEVWIFTCSSDEKHFSESWTACSKILNTALFKKF